MINYENSTEPSEIDAAFTLLLPKPNRTDLNMVYVSSPPRATGQ